nr:prepilin-type N-terminal cleavage/methylation domain-containing protein [uncultured Caproiciproducens sp.]
MVNTLRKTNKKGFTLVELVIVIAILAILAAIAIPTVSNVISTANKNVDLANAQTVELALKTADAEIEAKTKSGITTDSNVKTVLATYGITGIDFSEKGKSGATWKFENDEVFCESGHTSGTDLKNDTKLSAVITH